MPRRSRIGVLGAAGGWLLLAAPAFLVVRAASAQEPARVEPEEPAPAAAARLELREPRPEWLWPTESPGDDERAGFYRAFELEEVPDEAELFASCDNAFDLYLNGRLVASGGEWESALRRDVASALRAGTNVLKVECVNESGPAGLLLALALGDVPAAARVLRSDGDWLASVDPPSDWLGDDFAPTDWGAPLRLGAYGAEPWGLLDVAREGEGEGPDAGVLPAEELELPAGYRAELVYSVPRAREGSWVCMTFDERGRLIASDQHGALYRADVGSRPARVERLDCELGAAQGLLCAFGALYVVVNGERAEGSGLYRARDTNGDDRYDEVELLQALEGSGEHGPHAVVLGPDGTDLYVVAGNHTKLPPVDASRVPRVWDEDQLLPRLDDPNGHAVGVLAPGGWVCRTDPGGERWELFACGMRNSYDLAFDDAGELLTFDADMEWDVGLPWYRPTAVYHLTPGVDVGWRHGSGKWPSDWPDTIAPAVEVGPSSPTGVAFGRGAGFDGRLFLADWAYGNVYAVTLEERGASYAGACELFAEGRPLPVTDLAFGPDGALWLVTGGRGTRSGVYRIVYEGEPEPRARRRAKADVAALARRRLDARIGATDADVVEEAWPLLGSPDARLRSAARTALEHVDAALWAERALAEEQPLAALEALLALARVDGPGHGAAVVARVEELLPLESVESARLYDALRVLALAWIRGAAPDEATRARLGGRLATRFPCGERRLDRELARALAWLEAPGTAERCLERLLASEDQADAVHYALVLRGLRSGWTPDARERYFRWLHESAPELRGGASLQRYLEHIRADALAALEGPVRRRMQALLEEPRAGAAVEAGFRPRGHVRAWGVDELAAELARRAAPEPERGRALLREARCLDCHRFAGEGGSTGPDLTGAGGRFSPRDLLEAVLEPSAVVSDQYRDAWLELDDGELLVGRLEGRDGGRLLVRSLPPEEALFEVDAGAVVAQGEFELSRMPTGLLDVFEREEALDLLAHLLAGAEGR